MAIHFPTAMKYLILLGNLFGVTIFSIGDELSSWICLTIHVPFYVLYLIVHVLTLIEVNEEKDIGAYKRMGIISYYIIILTYMFIRFPYFIYKRHIYKKSILKLNKISTMLGKDNCFGVKMKNTLAAIAALLSGFIVLKLYYRFEAINSNSSAICVFVGLFDELLLFVVLNEIHNQLKYINSKITSYSYYRTIGTPGKSDVVTVENYKMNVANTKRNFLDNVFALSDIYMKLCKYIKVTNDIVGVPFLFYMSIAFVLITLSIHAISTDIAHGVNIYNILLYAFEVVFVLARLVIQINKLSAIVDESKETIIYVHKIWNGLSSINEIDVNAKHLKLLVVQMENVRPSFSASGSLNIDWSAIGMLIGGASIYVIILLQFEIATADNHMHLTTKEFSKNNTFVDQTPAAVEFLKQDEELYCPSNKDNDCSSLNVQCLTCELNSSCIYGKEFVATCTVYSNTIECKGDRSFQKPYLCRYCYQTDPWEHFCDLKANCNSIATTRSQYTTNCTVGSDILCLGSRTFNKNVLCNWTRGYRWSTALILSITLGGFGADRFYLGHWQEGIGKLFSFGGLGVWTLIDVILISLHYLGPADGSLYI